MTCTVPLTENRQVSTEGNILRTSQIARGWGWRKENAKGGENGGGGGVDNASDITFH